MPAAGAAVPQEPNKTMYSDTVLQFRILKEMDHPRTLQEGLAFALFPLLYHGFPKTWRDGVDSPGGSLLE